MMYYECLWLIACAYPCWLFPYESQAQSVLYQQIAARYYANIQ